MSLDLSRNEARNEAGTEAKQDEETNLLNA